MSKFGSALVIGAFLLSSVHAAPRSYVVRPGDTLYKIARESLGDAHRWNEIAALNDLAPPYAITVGATILLPDASGPSSSAPASDTAPAMMMTSDSTAAPVPMMESHHHMMPDTAAAMRMAVDTAVAAAHSDAAAAIPGASTPEEPTEYLPPLLAEVRARNKSIRAAKAYAEAASHRVGPAGALEDPKLSLGYQNGTGFDDLSSYGKDPDSEFMITLEQMFPGPGKRELRREIARHFAHHAEADLKLIECKILSDFKMHYWDLYRIKKERDILLRTRENLRELARGVDARYAAGTAPQEDVLRAGLEITSVTEQLRMLEREEHAAIGHINDLRDYEPTRPFGRPHEEPPYDLGKSVEDLAAMAKERSPALDGIRAMIMHEDAARRLAEANRAPDYGVFAGVFPRGELPAMWSAGVSITLPIYQGEKQSEQVKEAEANVEAARAEYDAHSRGMRAELEELYAMTDEARDLVKLYDSSMIPQSEFAIRASLAGYQAGRVDFMTVIANMVALKQYETERARRLADFHRSVAEMEVMTGRTTGEMP